MFVIYLFVKNPFIGEYHIIEFNENNKISEEDYNELCDILNNKYVIENIKIHKIASEVDFRHEGSYYIFFESSSFDNQKSDNLDYQKSQELYKKTINDMKSMIKMVKFLREFCIIYLLIQCLMKNTKKSKKYA